jgi:predicted Ser/Thr protein kinase
MLQAGATMAGYRIDDEIGSGGMGTVYEATQLSLDRTVALKVLASALGADDDFRARFRREAMLQAALDHPNIVPVYEAGEDGESLYIAMKLVRGTDLKRLSQEGDVEPERALAIVAQAAAALDAAHESGLVHRDVKPQNILVDEDDRAYLADFGITKSSGDRRVTLTGHYIGSLDYTPPERIRGEPVGAPGDLYAFAGVLLEALTGEVPFPYDDEAAILYAHVSEAPPSPSARRPELPAGLDDVVARGMAKRPEDRFRSATELVDAARRALASPPAETVAGNGRRRFGETIADPAVLRTAPVVDIAPARQIPWRGVTVAALVVAACALAGYALGVATRDDPGEGKKGLVAAGPLSLSFRDADWRRAAPPSIPGLRLAGPVALGSRNADRPGTVVAGIAPDAQGAGLLPRALKASLSGASVPHLVRLGMVTGLEYRDLPASRVPARMDLTLVPVPNGAAAVACLTPRVLPAGEEPADCGAVAATLALHGLRPLPPGAVGSYARELSSILARLDGERLAARRQLAGATRRVEQGRAARGLASAYAGAADRLLGAKPTPFARPSHDALYGALREAQRAYTAAWAAARSGDEARYARAIARAEAAEKKVQRSIARFERLRLP